MNNQISTEEAITRLQYLCSRAEKCEKDILDKLKKWNYNGDPLYIIGVLKKDNFLNEERFVGAFINDKIKYSKWGKKKVSYELKMRGIDTNLIENGLGKIPEDAYSQIVEDSLLKKNRSIKETDPFKREKKLLSFGYQRGFEFDIMDSIINKILNQT